MATKDIFLYYSDMKISRRVPSRGLFSWREVVPVVGAAAVSTAPPGFALDAKWFSERVVDFDLWLVCGGRAELEDSSGGRWELSRGSVVCLRPGSAVSLKVLPPTPYVNIFAHFDFAGADGVRIPPEKVDIPLSVTRAGDMVFFETAMRQILALDYGGAGTTPASRRELQSQLIRCLLLSLACEAGRPPSHAGRVASTAMSWIAQNPGGGTRSLAHHCGYSQRHFSRIFHSATGKSPGRAIVEVRVDQAGKLLATTALSISQIADSLGYSSVFYFSKQFKAITGMAPSGYRAKLRGDCLATPGTARPDLRYGDF